MTNFYRISLCVLVIIIALTSVLAPYLFDSTAYMILYLIFAAILFVTVIFLPDFFVKISHLLLLLIIISFVLIKHFNEREYYTFAEGGKYEIVSGKDTLSIQLIDFFIHNNSTENKLENYISELMINGQEVQISVNHPYSYKRFKLYQASYKNIQAFKFISQQDTLSIFPGQRVDYNGKKIVFKSYDELMQKASITINDNLYMLPLRDANKLFYVIPGDIVEASVIEYVEVKGHMLLLVLCIVSILMLIFVRIRG